MDLLDHMTQVAEQLAQQAGPVAKPSLVQALLKTIAFRLLGKLARVAHLNEGYVVSRIQSPTGFVTLFCLQERARCGNLSFTLEEIS